MKRAFNSCLLIALASSGQAYAASIDVDINNDEVQAHYYLSHSQSDAGLSAAVLLTEDKGEAVYFTARTQGQLSQQKSIRGGFGGRLFIAAPEEGDSFQSLAMGGFVDVTIPQAPAFIIGVEFYYAPGITTSDDIDNVKQFDFRATYQVFENAGLYVGLRYLEAEKNNSTYEFTEGAHVGFTLEF